MSRQSKADKNAQEKIVIANVIAATKERLRVRADEIIKLQNSLAAHMKARDDDHVFIVDIYERGIDAITGNMEPKIT